jgi:acyl-CoA synthetase (AMP-forming)/AMP-acid ligase II
VVGCGYPLDGVAVEIESEAGERLREGQVGEIVVRGPSLGTGYRWSADRDGDTTLVAGRLRTGDAGFMRDGELFVLGRFGDGLKLRGRHVFAEDVELALADAGIRRERSAALLGHHRGVPTAVVVLEGGDSTHVAKAAQVLRRCAEGATAVVVRAPRGTIERTSSGKPRRRPLWAAFVAGGIPGQVDHCNENGRKRGVRV